MEDDDRRHMQTMEDRAEWPDLVHLDANTKLGMSEDHFHAYGDLLPELENEYRSAFARRDPAIVYSETNIALKQRGIYLSKTSPEFQKAALAALSVCPGSS